MEMRMKLASVGVLTLLAFVAGSCFAANVSSEEAAKQAEFRKAYANIDKSERSKAVSLLEGLLHPSSLQMLATVAMSDRDDEVKKDAVGTLAKAPAHDPSVSKMLVTIFQAVKPSEIDERLAYARLMTGSQIKYPVVEVLADWGSKQRYPERFTGTRLPGQNVDPNIAIDKQRAQYKTFLDIFNGYTAAGLKATDRNSPAEVRKWWEQNAAKVAASDRELLDKYRVEDEARRDNNNSLVPKKTEKEDDTK